MMDERDHRKTENESHTKWKVLKRPIWIVILVLTFLLSNGVGILGNLDLSLTSTALAKKDKDNDGGSAGGGECDPSVGEYDLCANQGFITIKGMTGKVWARSTTGSIWTELTSSDVNVETGSGDAFATGLTEKKKFESDTGHIKINYCRTPEGTSNGLEITNLSTGDVDSRFFEGTQDQN